MKSIATALLTLVALAAIVSITLTTVVRHGGDEDADDCVTKACDWAKAKAIDIVDVIPVDDETTPIQPADPQPVKQGGQWTINCSSVDAGTTVADLLAPDGGTPKIVDTVYIAPIVGSSVKVRVGFAADIGGGTLTSSTGFEVGSGARDGPGVSLNASGRLRCKSEGAAQLVDVVAGRNQ